MFHEEEMPRLVLVVVVDQIARPTVHFFCFGASRILKQLLKQRRRAGDRQTFG